MSDIYLDETIIYSADVWPSVAIGMPEVQAHAMSCPVALYGEAVDKYDAAADRVLELQAEVKRLSAELTHRTQVWEGEEFKLRGELSDARAEVEKLKAALRGVSLAEAREAKSRERGNQELFDYMETMSLTRLRKEQEDERNGKVCPVVRVRVGSGLSDPQVNLAVADSLDHRLGLPQPDGDPVAPMSAKKPYRWGML